MMSAILRGFDFPARDIGDQLRFCNPLLSFDEGETAPIFLARDLDWQFEGEDRADWLTLVDADEVESFATLVSGEPLRIRRGEGVVLMGERFFSAARKVGIDPDRDRGVKFKVIREARCRIGRASVDSYNRFAGRLTGEAARIFDGELSGVAGEKLSAVGEAALFLLRKCGLTSPTNLAIRQLVAARVARQMDGYRRLLIRFSLELGDTEDDIHRRVDRHLEIVREGTEGTIDLIPELPGREQFILHYIFDDAKYATLGGGYLSYSVHPQSTCFEHFYVPASNTTYSGNCLTEYTPKDKSYIAARKIYAINRRRSQRKGKNSPVVSNSYAEFELKKPRRFSGIRYTSPRESSVVGIDHNPDLVFQLRFNPP